MRTAEVCPTCATLINAICVVYDGVYLTNTDVAPLDTLQTVITKINNNLVPKSGIVAPSSTPVYIGQLYVNTAIPRLYYAKGVSGPSDWVAL